jgi:hypothetical protein
MEMSAHKRVMDTNHARHELELKEAFVAVGGHEDGAGGADGKQLRFDCARAMPSRHESNRKRTPGNCSQSMVFKRAPIHC